MATAGTKERRFQHLLEDQALREDVPGIIRAVKEIDPMAVQRPKRTQRYSAVLLSEFRPDHDFLDAAYNAGLIVPLSRVSPKLQGLVEADMRDAGLTYDANAIFFIPMNRPPRGPVEQFHLFGIVDPESHVRSSAAGMDRELIGIIPHITFKGGGPKRQVSPVSSQFYSITEEIEERRYWGVCRLPTIRTVWTVSGKLAATYKRALEEGDPVIKLAHECGVRGPLTLRRGAVFKPLQYPLLVRNPQAFLREYDDLLTELERKKVTVGGAGEYPIHRGIEIEMFKALDLLGRRLESEEDVRAFLEEARMLIPDLGKVEDRSTSVEELKKEGRIGLVNLHNFLTMELRWKVGPPEGSQDKTGISLRDERDNVFGVDEAVERLGTVLRRYLEDRGKIQQQAVVFCYSVPLQTRLSELEELNRRIPLRDFERWRDVFKYYGFDLEGERFRGGFFVGEDHEPYTLSKMKVTRDGKPVPLDEARDEIFRRFILSVAVNCHVMLDKLRGTYTAEGAGTSLSAQNYCASGHVVDLDTCRTDLVGEEAEKARETDLQLARALITDMCWELYGVPERAREIRKMTRLERFGGLILASDRQRNWENAMRVLEPGLQLFDDLVEGKVDKYRAEDLVRFR